jgi:hypothetical protein
MNMEEQALQHVMNIQTQMLQQIQQLQKDQTSNELTRMGVPLTSTNQGFGTTTNTVSSPTIPPSFDSSSSNVSVSDPTSYGTYAAHVQRFSTLKDSLVVHLLK